MTYAVDVFFFASRITCSRFRPCPAFSERTRICSHSSCRFFLCSAAQREMIEKENHYRQLFAENPNSSEIQDPHLMLIDVFSNPNEWNYADETSDEVRWYFVDRGFWVFFALSTWAFPCGILAPFKCQYYLNMLNPSMHAALGTNLLSCRSSAPFLAVSLRSPSCDVALLFLARPLRFQACRCVS